MADQALRERPGLQLILREERGSSLELSQRLLGETGPALLLVGDAAELESWREQLQPWPNQLDAAVVRLAAHPEESPWFLYNDPRCNGSKPLQHWQGLYPNLELRQVEIDRRHCLGEVLQQWDAHGEGLVVAHTERGGMAEVLAGLGNSSLRVSRLELAFAEALTPAVVEELDQQLWMQGALQRQGGELIWVRDEHEAFRRSVLNERDALVKERDALVKERDALVKERDALVKERDALVKERDALVKERDALVKERDALVSRVAERDGRLDQINTELDEILALIDSASLHESTPA